MNTLLPLRVLYDEPWLFMERGNCPLVCASHLCLGTCLINMLLKPNTWQMSSDMLFCDGRHGRVHSQGKEAFHKHRPDEGTAVNILERCYWKRGWHERLKSNCIPAWLWVNQQPLTGFPEIDLVYKTLILAPFLRRGLCGVGCIGELWRKDSIYSQTIQTKNCILLASLTWRREKNKIVILVTNYVYNTISSKSVLTIVPNILPFANSCIFFCVWCFGKCLEGFIWTEVPEW